MELDHVSVLRIILLGGALGGLSQVFVRSGVEIAKERRGKAVWSIFYIEPDRDNLLGFVSFAIMCAAGIVVGMAGAAGLCGAFALIKIFDAAAFAQATKPAVIQLRMELWGVSVVGGFVAKKMLPILGDNLTSRVTESEKQIENQKKLMERHDRELSSVKKINEEQSRELEKLQAHGIISDAYTALRERKISKSKERFDAAAKNIKELFWKNKNIREAAILAARFCVERIDGDSSPPDYDEAINVLTEYIGAGNIKDFDLADAYYNRACYHIEKMGNVNDRDKALAKLSAINDLKISFDKKPENKSFAAVDDDLRPLFNDQDFKEILQPLTPRLNLN